MTLQRIKLCLITKFFHPVLAGGAERFRHYAPGLQKRGIDLDVFTALPPGYPKLIEREVVDGISITRFPLADAYKEYPKLVRAALNQFQQPQKKPDIVQIFSASPQITHDILHFRLLGAGMIFVSTMVSNEAPVKKTDKLKNWLYLQASMLGINRIVASTDVMKASLVSRGIHSRRVMVIPNGIDTERFRPAISLEERRSIRQKLGIQDNDQVILFVGSIIPRKGVDLLIEAWPKIISNNPRVRLVLVGAYGEQTAALFPEPRSMVLDYFNKITQTIENFPYKDRIVFTGEDANVEEYLRAADLFVFPSRQEGMGNVVLEAMATGLPCIITPYIGLPSHEFGQSGREFILLDGHDPKEIASRVNQLLEDKNMMKAIGQSARQWVEKNMGIEKILDHYATVYRDLAVNKRSSI